MSIPLKNLKREAFAQAIVCGLSQTKAHKEAGFSGGASSASILARREDVRSRINELFQERRIALGRDVSATADEQEEQFADIDRNGMVSRAWILKRMVSLVIDSAGRMQYGQTVKALELLGREVNLYGDKLVVPPTFDPRQREQMIPLAKINALLEDVGFAGSVELLPTSEKLLSS